MSSLDYRISPEDWQEWLLRAAGPQLVVAGPGTGKTEFLVRRIVSLVEEGTAQRGEIAMLTFSRRAAREIERRINDALGASGLPIEVSTFHSLALRMLEHHTGERPVVLTAPEQVALVSRLLEKEDPSDWPLPYRGILESRGFAAEIADFLMRCSERLLSPRDLDELAQVRTDWRGIPALFERYREELRRAGRTDYGTLLVSAVDYLATESGQQLATGYRYVVVDEYQDTSLAQAAMARLLSAPHGNITVAADPYQSVYSFRGADLGNVVRFSDENPGTVRLVLDRSFRVPEEILEAALRVVSEGELPGAAGPVQPAPHPGRVEAYVFDQETAEAEWIAAEVERALRIEHLEPHRIAVLVRSKKELISELSRALRRRRIPHDPPDSRLVDHPAIRVVADLVSVCTHDRNEDLATATVIADRAMRRVLLGPVVGLGLGQEQALVRIRRSTGARWSDVCAENLEGHSGLARLLQQSDWAVKLPASDGFWLVWSEVEGFSRVVDDPALAEWRTALASFSQVLARQAERDPGMTLATFFELTEDERFEPTPLISLTRGSEGVSLTTLHQSKGLEFDVVFIANAVEGVFPDLRRSRRMLRPELLSPERTANFEAQHLFQVQEEMRLAYTAMTRARRRVVWTATDAGVDQGEKRPSRFLLAAAGVRSIEALGPPADRDGDPVTMAEFEARVRRLVLDPAADVVDRVAAAALVAEAPGNLWDPMRLAGVAERGDDRPILPERVTLSPSQADAYETCPRQYALQRRLRLGDSTSPYLQFGSLVHEVLERVESAILGTDAPHAPLADALETLDVVWEQADFGSPSLTRAWRGKAEELLVKLYENWPSNGVPIAVETWVESDIAGTPWRGKVDRVERVPDGLKVVDYKTGTRPPTKDDAAVSVQLGFYRSAIEDKLDQSVCAAELWFPRANTKSVSIRHLDPDNRAEVEARMERVTTDILAERWEPRLNDRCDKCEFRHSCPAWTGASEAFVP